MTESTSLESLFRSLRDGYLLVTANDRLARVISQQYGAWRMAGGDRQWPTPDVLPWSAWESKLWQAAGLAGLGTANRAIPGRQQLLSLWAQVIRDDAEDLPLLRPESLARAVRDTRANAVQWQVPLNHPAWHGEDNENHAAFQRWNRAFEGLCGRNGWLPPEDRLPQLISADAASTLNPGSLSLVGFDEFTPLQQAWLEQLRSAGCSVADLRLESGPTEGQVWRSESEEDQLDRMARWVRHYHEQDPGSRIAVVVADLQSRRAEVERALTAVFCPGRLPGDGNVPWNVSMGLPLLDWPMVRAAFDILQLVDCSPSDPRVELQAAGRLLRSPWIKGARAERQSRALLEKCLREHYQRQLKMSEVRYRARELEKFDADRQPLPEPEQSPKPWNSPLLARLADQLIRFETQTRKDMPPSAWADAFESLLERMGWAAGRGRIIQPRLAGSPGLAGCPPGTGDTGRHPSKNGPQQGHQPASLHLRRAGVPARGGRLQHPGAGSLRGQRTAL